MLDSLMSRDNIMPRLNQRILFFNTAPLVSIAGGQQVALDPKSFSSMDKNSLTLSFARSLHYILGG